MSTAMALNNPTKFFQESPVLPFPSVAASPVKSTTPPLVGTRSPRPGSRSPTKATAGSVRKQMPPRIKTGSGNGRATLPNVALFAESPTSSLSTTRNSWGSDNYRLAESSSSSPATEPDSPFKLYSPIKEKRLSKAIQVAPLQRAQHEQPALKPQSSVRAVVASANSSPVSATILNAKDELAELDVWPLYTPSETSPLPVTYNPHAPITTQELYHLWDHAALLYKTQAYASARLYFQQMLMRIGIPEHVEPLLRLNLGLAMLKNQQFVHASDEFSHVFRTMGSIDHVARSVGALASFCLGLSAWEAGKHEDAASAFKSSMDRLYPEAEHGFASGTSTPQPSPSTSSSTGSEFDFNFRSLGMNFVLTTTAVRKNLKICEQRAAIEKRMPMMGAFKWVLEALPNDAIFEPEYVPDEVKQTPDGLSQPGPFARSPAAPTAEPSTLVAAEQKIEDTRGSSEPGSQDSAMWEGPFHALEGPNSDVELLSYERLDEWFSGMSDHLAAGNFLYSNETSRFSKDTQTSAVPTPLLPSALPKCDEQNSEVSPLPSRNNSHRGRHQSHTSVDLKPFRSFTDSVKHHHALASTSSTSDLSSISEQYRFPARPLSPPRSHPKTSGPSLASMIRPKLRVEKHRNRSVDVVESRSSVALAKGKIEVLKAQHARQPSSPSSFYETSYTSLDNIMSSIPYQNPFFGKSNSTLASSSSSSGSAARSKAHTRSQSSNGTAPFATGHAACPTITEQPLAESALASEDKPAEPSKSDHADPASRSITDIPVHDREQVGQIVQQSSEDWREEQCRTIISELRDLDRQEKALNRSASAAALKDKKSTVSLQYASVSSSVFPFDSPKPRDGGPSYASNPERLLQVKRDAAKTAHKTYRAPPPPPPPPPPPQQQQQLKPKRSATTPLPSSSASSSLSSSPPSSSAKAVPAKSSTAADEKQRAKLRLEIEKKRSRLLIALGDLHLNKPLPPLPYVPLPPRNPCRLAQTEPSLNKPFSTQTTSTAPDADVPPVVAAAESAPAPVAALAAAAVTVPAPGPPKLVSIKANPGLGLASSTMASQGQASTATQSQADFIPEMRTRSKAKRSEMRLARLERDAAAFI